MHRVLLLASVVGAFACTGDEVRVQALPECPACTGGAIRGGVFAEELFLDGRLRLTPDARDAIQAEPAGARFLARAEAEIGLEVIELAAPTPDNGDVLRPVTPAPGGGTYTIAVGPGQTTLLSRLEADGRQRWQHSFPGYFYLTIPVPTRDGVVLVRRAPDGTKLDSVDDDGTVRYALDGLPTALVVGPGLGGGVAFVGAGDDTGVSVLDLDRDGVTTATRTLRASDPGGGVLPSAVTLAPDRRVLVAGAAVGDGLVVGADTFAIPAHNLLGTATFVVEITADGGLGWAWSDATLPHTIRAIAPVEGGAIVGSDVFTPGRGGRDATVMEVGPGGVRWSRLFGGDSTQDSPRVAVSPSGAVFASVISERVNDEGEPTLDAGDTQLRGHGTLVVELGR